MHKKDFEGWHTLKENLDKKNEKAPIKELFISSASALLCGSTKAAVWLSPICASIILSLLASCQEVLNQE